MKQKNPLYVVKGKDVEQASSFLDLVIKKLNLAPLIQIFENILKLLWAQAQSFALVVAVKKILEDLIHRIQELGKKLGAFSV